MAGVVLAPVDQVRLATMDQTAVQAVLAAMVEKVMGRQAGPVELEAVLFMLMGLMAVPERNGRRPVLAAAVVVEWVEMPPYR